MIDLLKELDKFPAWENLKHMDITVAQSVSGRINGAKK